VKGDQLPHFRSPFCLLFRQFFQQKDPTDEFGPDIFLGDKMSNDNMINIYYHLIPNKIYPKLIKGKYYNNQLFFSCGITELGITEGSIGILYHVKCLVLSLPQHCPDCIITYITHQLKR